MKKNLLTLIIAFGLTSNLCAQTVLTQWNFNTQNASPSTGVGTITNIGGVTNTYASGSATGGSSDPVTPTSDNYAYNTKTYPAVSANNKTAGIEFAVNTTGREGIIVGFDVRHSNTASRYLVLQYSTDGATFTDAATFVNTPGDAWYNNSSYNFTSITGLNNNANAKFRIVTDFAPATTNYVAATTTSTYGTSGT